MPPYLMGPLPVQTLCPDSWMEMMWERTLNNKTDKRFLGLVPTPPKKEESEGFSSVFVGQRGDNKISGNWTDISMGSLKDSVDLEFSCLRINGVPTLTQTSGTGGFGGKVFVRSYGVAGSKNYQRRL